MDLKKYCGDPIIAWLRTKLGYLCRLGVCGVYAHSSVVDDEDLISGEKESPTRFITLLRSYLYDVLFRKKEVCE